MTYKAIKNKGLIHIIKKNKGISELISSLVVMTTLIILLFLSLGIIQDIQKITSVDQIARQSIIEAETKGYLNQDTLNLIKTNIQDNCNAKFDGKKTIGGKEVLDGVYMAYKNGSSWEIINTDINSLTQETKLNYFGYGKNIGIYIQCEVKTTGIGSERLIGKNNTTQVCRLKTSISKNMLKTS